MIEATNELYKSCERTIKKACVNAWIRNPIIQLDDYLSYADEIFMDATKSFDESRGIKFNSWLTTQLMRVREYAGRFKMVTEFKRNNPTAVVLSLDKKTEFLENRPCTLMDLKSSVNDIYSERLIEPDFSQGWSYRLETFKPYLGEMSEDAKAMVDDIIVGDTEKKDENGVPILPRGKSKYVKLTPRQLYTRLYCRKGWSLERVKNARNEIENILIKISPEMKMLKTRHEENSGFVQEELF